MHRMNECIDRSLLDHQNNWKPMEPKWKVDDNVPFQERLLCIINLCLLWKQRLWLRRATRARASDLLGSDDVSDGKRNNECTISDNDQ